MIKTLLKKQLAELFASMFNRSAFGKGGKKGKKKRGKGAAALYIFLILYVCIVLGAMFYIFAEMLFDAFIPAGISWLGFSLMGIAATGLGVIGTVFLTNSMLYNAKDNDLLLSMPIKPWQIIFSRVFTLYIMDLLYEALVLVPCFAAYIIRCGISFGVMLSGVFMLLVLPLLSLALSLVLGFLVAIASGRMKNKSLITVIVSVVFIALYFYVVAELQNYIALLVANGALIAKNIKAFAYPVYAMGMACTGDILGLLVFLAVVLALFALVYYVLTKSFLKLATAKRGAKKAVYREKSYRMGSAMSALLKKEFLHFWSSPTYMLNSSVGSIFIIIAAVFVFFKGGDLAQSLLVLQGAEELIPLIICALVCAMASMNIITAPSVSLEGRNLWLLRSLPVSAWEVLKSKIALHMILSGIPSFIFAVVCVSVFPMDAAAMTIIPMMAIISNLMFAFMGLAFNLKHPSFDWTNEAVPVKQGLSVILSMLTSTGIIIFFAIVYVILSINVHLPIMGTLYMLCVMLVCAVATFVLYIWLQKRGTKIFDSLY